jgi:molybdenum cofactor synthesis domain-containing protein
MISLEQARRRVAEQLPVLAPTEVPLAAARGLVLAETVTATEAIPPFANTAMDGFAVRHRDLTGATDATPVTLPVAATVAAGSVAPRPLEAGEVMRIMTGAPIPDGADAVVMVELTRPVAEQPDQPERVEIIAEVPEGNHVRPAGDDINPGDDVMEPGTVLGPGHLGVLASLGRETVTVHPRATVGVLSTGDELVEGSDPLEPGQIRDSNRITLLSLAADAGFATVDLGKIPDDEDQIEAALRRGAATCDAIITSGGVSMGDYDYVKAVLVRLGGFEWMQVAIKPAKPLVFGLLDGVPVFGLPGNPVSSMVSFELFARPGLWQMMGRPGVERLTVTATAEAPLRRRPDGKTHFGRVVVSQGDDGTFLVRPAGGQGSHQLVAMATADGLAVLADGPGAEVGDTVEVLLLGSVTGP